MARRLSIKKKQGKRHTPEQIISRVREAATLLVVGKMIGCTLETVGRVIEENRLCPAAVIVVGQTISSFAKEER